MLPANSSEQQLIEVFKDYKQGNYPAVLKKLKEINTPKSILSTKFYLAGLAHNRLENYVYAIESFKKSAALKNTSRDLFYEYAQALYANNQLEAAIVIFKKSIALNFKVPSSLYYIAYAWQLLEKYRMANNHYKLLLKNKRSDRNLQQIARLYIAENFIKMAEKKSDREKIISKYVLPQLDKAIQEDPHSKLADDIDRRKIEIINLFKLDPNILNNGKNSGSKRWNLSFSEKFRYDNNITFSSDQPTTRASQKDSYISTTSMLIDLNYPLYKKYILNPTLGLEKIHHTRRRNSEVIVNDENSINATLNFSYEHTYNANPASLTFTFNHLYTERDKDALKTKMFTNRATTLTLSESFHYFKFGESSLSLGRTTLSSYDENLNSETTTFSFSQYYTLNNGHFMLINGALNFARVQDDEDSTDSANATATYIIPNINRDYTVTLGFSVVFLDPKKQEATRGIEKTYSPSLILTKKASHNLQVSINYEFKHHNSRDESFSYEKQVSGFALSYSF